MLQIETNGSDPAKNKETGGGAPCDVPPPAQKWGTGYVSGAILLAASR